MPGLDQPDPTDQLEVKASVDNILNRHPAVGLAVGVVRDGALESFFAHGLADIASNTPVTRDTVFRIGSITKTFTAIAVMQLSEQGLVDLDAPANNYLRAYRLVPAKARFRPATVRHLLTHTAGISEQVPPSGLLRRDFGETVKLGGRIPSLAEYYRGGLRLEAEPGTRFRYGDHGPATLGQLVEDVSGQPFHRYLREHVFGPLGMADTALLRSEVDPSRLATGYRLGSRGARAVAQREYVPAGAGAIFSTPRDMARYLAALLGGAPTGTVRCCGPRRWRPCSRPTTSPIPGSQAWDWRSSASAPAATPPSSTRVCCLRTTRRSSSLPTTASASWPSPTGPPVRRRGCRSSWAGCSTRCSASPTRWSVPTSRNVPRSGRNCAAGTPCPAP